MHRLLAWADYLRAAANPSSSRKVTTEMPLSIANEFFDTPNKMSSAALLIYLTSFPVHVTIGYGQESSYEPFRYVIHAFTPHAAWLERAYSYAHI